MPAPLAQPSDVADIWRPLSTAETTQVTSLIAKASAKLRQKAPFDVDARITLFTTNPTAPTALDPTVVADVVATIVKRFMVNIDGVASSSEGVGPYSRSATYVNRYDKTGSDVRGAIQVTDSDIEQLRPAVPAPTVGTFRVNIPRPEVLVPYGRRTASPVSGQGYGSVIVPDVNAIPANGYESAPPDGAFTDVTIQGEQ
jgi:hypothetical protein